MASNGIERLAVTRLSSAVAYSTGTTAFTSNDYYLVSVIATNTAATDAEIYIYVVPSGASETGYGLIAYKLTVPAYNSYETFRFGVNPTDVVKVAGPAGMAFYVQGIDQTA
jgi:hypothetical protein